LRDKKGFVGGKGGILLPLLWEGGRKALFWSPQFRKGFPTKMGRKGGLAANWTLGGGETGTRGHRPESQNILGTY